MFGKKTIDKIIVDISEKIKELRNLAEVHAAEAEVHKIEAETHRQLFLVKENLRDRATRVAENFEALLR